MRMRSILLALPLAGSLLATPLAHDDVRLAWKFAKGDVLRYRNSTKTEQTISGPAEVTNTTEMQQLIEETVRSVDEDGSATLHCEWKAVRMHVSSSMGSEIDYDSTDAASTPPDALKGVAKLVGLAFEMRMRPTGEITELEGMDEALAKLFESDAPDVGAMRQMMSEMLSEETMKRSLEAAVLPSHALKEGEEWKRAIAIPLGPLGKLDAAYVYRYEGLATAPAPRTAKIGLEFTMKAATGQPDFSAIPGSELLDIALDIGDSTGKGTLEFDVDAGRLARSSVETEIELTMEMKLKEAPEGADMPPMEMHIEMAMRNDMRLLGPDEPAFEPRPKSGK